MIPGCIKALIKYRRTWICQHDTGTHLPLPVNCKRASSRQTPHASRRFLPRRCMRGNVQLIKYHRYKCLPVQFCFHHGHAKLCCILRRQTYAFIVLPFSFSHRRIHIGIRMQCGIKLMRKLRNSLCVFPVLSDERCADFYMHSVLTKQSDTRNYLFKPARVMAEFFIRLIVTAVKRNVDPPRRVLSKEFCPSFINQRAVRIDGQHKTHFSQFKIQFPEAGEQ